MTEWRLAIAAGLLVGAVVGCPDATEAAVCHQPIVYRDGTHLGFRVGMTREQAAEAAAPYLVRDRAFAIWDRDEVPPRISVPRRNERFARSLSDLRAPGWTNEEWMFT